ncbi:1050_t:CDS:2 [Ambispora gerdemannii]|uniref:N-acetylglucosaminylphosphatidylinositol deacetylase n=1 Tax=Ambispora gerdemannii TaxID=144530 RepID=A0A9N9GXH5_9GLOM|nr:1050_t:CDS:2 [Ambispora gerdemannii]
MVALLLSLLTTTTLLFLFSYFFYRYSLYSTAKKARLENVAQRDEGILRDRSILLVIAHPDDECMFFGPTLLSLSERNDIMILCLSSGNEQGLGEERKIEIEQSCRVFGIDESLVNVEEHPALQDNPKELWNTAVITDILKEYVEKNGIDTIISFDERGVSGHLNHIAAFHGANQLIASYGNQTTDVHFYKLKTVNRFRKYISLLDLPYAYYKFYIAKKCSKNQQTLAQIQKISNGNGFHYSQPNKNTKKPRPVSTAWKRKSLLSVSPPLTKVPDCLLFVSSPEQYKQTLDAMKCHKTQLVWFRRLYVKFSRYMIINNLERVK